MTVFPAEMAILYILLNMRSLTVDAGEDFLVLKKILLRTLLLRLFGLEHGSQTNSFFIRPYQSSGSMSVKLTIEITV